MRAIIDPLSSLKLIEAVRSLQLAAAINARNVVKCLALNFAPGFPTNRVAWDGWLARQGYSFACAAIGENGAVFVGATLRSS